MITFLSYEHICTDQHSMISVKCITIDYALDIQTVLTYQEKKTKDIEYQLTTVEE